MVPDPKKCKKTLKTKQKPSSSINVCFESQLENSFYRSISWFPSKDTYELRDLEMICNNIEDQDW